MREISQRELRNESGRIMRELEAGESFIVTSNGRPIGELTPLRRRRFVPREAIYEAFKDAPPIDYQQMRDEMDAVLDPDWTPRG
jgi:prevent-host-death family protein